MADAIHMADDELQVLTDWRGNPKLYTQRWLMLGLYFAINLSTSCVWASMAIVQTTVQNVYHQPAHSVVMLTNVFYLLYTPGTMLSVWTLGKWGVRTTVMLGGALVVVAAGVRGVSGFTASFAAQVIGSICGGLGQPLVLNGCSQLSADWFGSHERNFATMMGETAPAALGGAALGLAAAKFSVNSAEQLGYYFWGITCFAFLTFVTFSLGYKSKPPTRPCFVAAPHFTVMETLSMFKNRQYCLLVFIIGADYSFICTFPALMNGVYASVGLDQDLADTALSLFLFLGVSGCFVLAPIVDQLKQRDMRTFQWTILFANVAIVVALIMTALFTRPHNKVALTASVCFMSFFATGVIPIGIEASAEVVYPLPEGASAGFLIMCGNVLGFCFVYISSAIAKAHHGDFTIALWVQVGLGALAVCACIAFRPRYRREAADGDCRRRGTSLRRTTSDVPKTKGQYDRYTVDESLSSSLLDN